MMLALSALVTVVCGSAAAENDAGATAAGVTFVDFATLQPPESPNTWLVAPPGFTRAVPDEAAPEFPVEAVWLGDTWREVVAAEPRTTITGTSADGMQIEAEQQSLVFGFIDDISFRAIPLAADRSTLAIYSRARVGYWDLGVNRTRVRSWLDQLRRKVAARPAKTR